MEVNRILQIGMTDNPGGVESFIMNIYRNIDRSKYQFDFLILHDTEIAYKDEILRMGGNIYPILYGRRENTFKHYYKLFGFFLKHHHYIAIHHHSLSINCIDELLFAKIFKIPVRIMHSHNSGADGKNRAFSTFFSDRNRKRLNKVATQKFACSGTAGQWMFQDDAFKIIQNGIDRTKYEFNSEVRLRYKKELGLENNSTIGFIGRLAKQKNPMYAIDIMNEVIKKNPLAKLIIVSTGPMEDDVRSYVKSLGLDDSVMFLGIRKDVSLLLSVIDVLIMPSLFEGLPFVLVEAQAASLKCLVSENITREAAITDSLEYLSIDVDPNVWATRINEIISSEYIRSKPNSEQFSEFDIFQIVESMVDVYLNK